MSKNRSEIEKEVLGSLTYQEYIELNGGRNNFIQAVKDKLLEEQILATTEIVKKTVDGSLRLSESLHHIAKILSQ
ncbi:hypothetical protein SAMN04487895_101620 [Paenibacillus sophorae]|uniref:Uncharacterized protein n=1 Tax=Paenibacillus sophorae TaxID=1333845 RepID=A0A1H8GS55_9BACL|nr:hypothetical protein [Paenibacillus sophorae]QWU14317.1 hypothetical protein KP014_20640 [Paenibacillus sophorae]SEN46639.1 hypothetical protein SAMN04487895_101620 [Paenibacillus sophorae]